MTLTTIRLFLVALLAMGVAGCAPTMQMPRIEMPAGAGLSEEMLQALREGRVDQLQAAMSALQAQQMPHLEEMKREAARTAAERQEYQLRFAPGLFTRTLIMPAYDQREGRPSKDLAQTMRRTREMNEAMRVAGNREREIAFHRGVLAARERELGAAHIETAFAAAHLGDILAEWNERAEAETLLRRAVAIGEASAGPRHDLALLIDRLAEFLHAGGATAEAHALYQRALLIWEQTPGAIRQQLATENNVGVTAEALGDRTRARLHYRKAIALVDRPGALFASGSDVADSNPFSLVRGATVALSNAGLLAWRERDPAAALPHFRRARSLQAQTQWVYFERGASEPQRMAMLNEWSQEVEALSAFGQGDGRAVPGSARVALTAILDHKGRGLEALARTMSAVVRQKPPGSAPVTANEKPETAMARAAMQNALAIAGRRQGGPSNEALRAELDQVRARRANLAVSGTDTGARRAEIEELERRERALLAQLSNRLEDERFDALMSQEMRAMEREGELSRPDEPDDAMIRRVIGMQEEGADAALFVKVQAALPPRSALVELATFRPLDPLAADVTRRFGPLRYVAYVLQGTGEPRTVDLGDAATIEKLVVEFRRGLADPGQRGVYDAARRLDARVMQPVRALLGDAEHVLLSPEGVLHLVPFGALRDENGRFLVERFTLTYLTTGRDVLRMAVSDRSPRPAAIVADPDFGNRASAPIARADSASPSAPRSVDFREVTFDQLPGTAGEARALKALFPEAALLTGPAATETAVKALHAPRFLHIASHGFFLPDQRREASSGAAAPARENPLVRSGLVFAGVNRLSSGADDGVLTALELAGLDLSGTRLVTLSACETGLGDVQTGEGVFGLRRALSIAGAESQVISLWKVSDESTEALMVDFYRRLKAGAGRSDALRRAQLAMVADPAFAHPYFWAAFIASGDWRPLPPE